MGAPKDAQDTVTQPKRSPRMVGRYALYESIGAGGFATVHLGRLLGPGGFARLVAIKRLHSHVATDRELVEKLLEEAQLVARIRHPNVVQVLDAVALDREFLIVMDYVEGVSLARLVKLLSSAGTEQLPLSITVAIVSDLLEGLHAAHSARSDGGDPLCIVHRDVSPQNVLVGIDGQAKVIDFGIAKVMGSADVTRGSFKGKVAYAAPEQLLGERATPETDIFSTGVILWELLTGRRLFAGSHDGELILNRLTRTVEPPSHFAPIPKELDDVVLRALARESSERFPSARQMASALEQVVAPAPSRSVAELIEQLAGEELAQRASRLRDLEQIPPPRTPSELPPGHGSATSYTKRRSAVPAELTSFVGRENELHQLRELYAKTARLVTLTGPAGAGKTRLAVHYAQLAEREKLFPGGIYFCDLVEARNCDDLQRTLTQTLSVHLGSADELERIERLGFAIAARGTALFMFDNFEQLVASARELLQSWLADAPDARFLVTSRERLRIRGEHRVDVAPLPVPDASERDATKILESPAVMLFLQRARAGGDELTLHANDVLTLGELVRHLDGLPLAIELCAARSGVLGPGQLLSQLSRRFELLTQGAAEAGAHHATLRGALSWSWELLGPDERAALGQCAVFRNGWALDAALHVIRVGSTDTLSVLQTLHDKSLLVVGATPGLPEERRFRLLESVREFALEQTGSDPALEERHADYFLHAGAKWAEEVELTGSVPLLCRLEVEASNLMSIHERAMQQRNFSRALEALLVLEPLFMTHGHLDIYLKLLDGALDANVESESSLPLVARASLARARTKIGMSKNSRSDCEQALRLAEQAGDKATTIQALVRLSVDVAKEGHVSEANALVQRAERLLDDDLRTRQPRLQRLVEFFFGFAAHCSDNVEEAQRRFERALHLARMHGATRDEAWILHYLGEAHRKRGELADAVRAYQRCVSLAQESGDHHLEAGVALGLGSVLAEQGRLEEAHHTLTQIVRLSQRRFGDREVYVEALCELGGLALERGDVVRAIERYRSAVAALPQLSSALRRGIVLAQLAVAEVYASNLSSARQLFEEAAPLVEHSGVAGDKQAFALLRAELGVAEAVQLTAAGDVDSARQLASQVLDLAQQAKRAGRGSVTQLGRFALRLLERALLVTQDAAFWPAENGPRA